jgi:amino acid transporter
MANMPLKEETMDNKQKTAKALLIGTIVIGGLAILGAIVIFIVLATTGS